MCREGTLLSSITYSSTGWVKLNAQTAGSSNEKWSLDGNTVYVHNGTDGSTPPGKSKTIAGSLGGAMSNSNSSNSSIGDKIINFACKIFKVLIISTVIETDPLILQEILSCAKYLLDEIPLLSLSTITGTRIKCLVEFEILAMRFFKVCVCVCTYVLCVHPLTLT